MVEKTKLRKCLVLQVQVVLQMPSSPQVVDVFVRNLVSASPQLDRCQIETDLHDRAQTFKFNILSFFIFFLHYFLLKM